MDFLETETQTLLRETADRLVRDKYDFDARKKIVALPEGYSPDAWFEFANLGLLGVDAAEEHGGSGGSFADLAVVLEAFGRGLVVEPYLSSIVLSAAALRAADGGKNSELLAKLAAGETTMALAYAEPGSGFDSAWVETTAKAEGSSFTLNGHKAVALGADNSEYLLVSARTAGAPGDAAGISLFLIPRGAAGVTIRPCKLMDDRTAADIVLENVKVGADALVGERDKALPVLEEALDRATAAVCCEAVGAMNAVNLLTLDYLKTRQQFGRPIGKFQVLQHRMADMMMAEQTARSMMALAIANAENPDAKERSKAISAAKVQVGNSGNIVGRGAIQLHGGIGMTDEYIAGHYFRRLTAIEKMFGDTDWHLARFAALSR
ncbi:MAG: acyl-CoA dehydrogenase family protein [Beijerinckiaceae bacterium]